MKELHGGVAKGHFVTKITPKIFWTQGIGDLQYTKMSMIFANQKNHIKYINHEKESRMIVIQMKMQKTKQCHIDHRWGMQLGGHNHKRIS